MDKKFENLLVEWPLAIIKDVDISVIFSESDSKRYATVNRALKKGILIHLRRGIYLINKPYRKSLPSQFEIAHFIYGPSYISFESALAYHQWIPEATYTTTCASAKRSNTFETSVGIFQYTHVPENLFYLGVRRIGNEDEAFYIAEPWKALADHYYVHERNWNHLEDLYLDMRIEMEYLLESDLQTLESLSKNYHSRKVRTFLKTMLRSIRNGN